MALLISEFQRSLFELYMESDLRPSPDAIARLVGKVLRSRLTVMGYRNREGIHQTLAEANEVNIARLEPVYESLVHEHPVRNRFRLTGAPGPHLMSDAISLGGFKSTGLYHDYFRHFGVTRLAAIYVPLAAREYVSLGVSRDGADFSDEERLLLGMVQPHLARSATRRWPSVWRRPLVPRCAGRVGLTRREEEVWRGLLAGRNDAALAAELGISVATVKKHVTQVLIKVGASNRRALAEKKPPHDRR